MITFVRKMEEFAALQLEKFINVAWKHGGVGSESSVTSESYKWSSPQDLFEIREHLQKEIKELEAAPLNTEAEEKELIDVANCAMLLCMKRRALRGIDK